MDFRIRGRTALVTGASAGLGYASALALAREGVRLAIVSRSRENIDKAAESIRKETGSEVAAFVADVSDLDAVPALADQVRARLGPITILVANAGGPPAGTFMELSREAFDTAYRLTLMSSIELCRAVLPDMRTAGWGRIVAITSTTVKQPIDGLLLSNVFRAGLTGFLKTISREVAAAGITVNSVAPGYTDTERLVELAEHMADRQDSTIESVRKSWAESTPIKRLGRPDEIGDAVAWLCSEQASFMTGRVLTVDGGRFGGL